MSSKLNNGLSMSQIIFTENVGYPSTSETGGKSFGSIFKRPVQPYSPSPLIPDRLHGSVASAHR
jgi:hypothetical protein